MRLFRASRTQHRRLQSVYDNNKKVEVLFYIFTFMQVLHEPKLYLLDVSDWKWKFVSVKQKLVFQTLF